MKRLILFFLAVSVVCSACNNTEKPAQEAVKDNSEKVEASAKKKFPTREELDKMPIEEEKKVGEEMLAEADITRDTGTPTIEQFWAKFKRAMLRADRNTLAKLALSHGDGKIPLGLFKNGNETYNNMVTKEVLQKISRTKAEDLKDAKGEVPGFEEVKAFVYEQKNQKKNLQKPQKEK